MGLFQCPRRQSAFLNASSRGDREASGYTQESVPVTNSDIEKQNIYP